MHFFSNDSDKATEFMGAYRKTFMCAMQPSLLLLTLLYMHLIDVADDGQLKFSVPGAKTCMYL